MLALSVPAFRSWVLLSQLLQYARGQSRVNQIVGEVANVAWPLHLVRVVLQPAQPEQLLVEINRERLHPLPQLLGDERLKDLCECVPRAVILIAGRLVDKGDDADAGESPIENP